MDLIDKVISVFHEVLGAKENCAQFNWDMKFMDGVTVYDDRSETIKSYLRILNELNHKQFRNSIDSVVFNGNVLELHYTQPSTGMSKTFVFYRTTRKPANASGPGPWIVPSMSEPQIDKLYQRSHGGLALIEDAFAHLVPGRYTKMVS